ncbi:MAG: very short patch repair endonuclease [Parasphingorhabdus sp.]
MADIVTPEARSHMMAAIRSKNTRPEMILRKGLHAAGFRFRLHDKTLPGKPDIVFPRFSAVIMAQGCFWHGHDCHLFTLPSTRPEFWRSKIDRNRQNDARTHAALAKAGWRQAEVWECALKGKTRLSHNEVIDVCRKWLRSEAIELVIRGQ